MDSFHCPDYEELTIEEKLLVDIEMREWYARARVNLPDLCAPTFVFRELERRIIEKLKEKEKHGDSSHRRRNDL